ncbi:MAG: alpha-amylase [Candidatus Riflebacteria bacterium]|nr:alpha-amylase [Candidatus Riflebacteria bacterium]
MSHLLGNQGIRLYNLFPRLAGSMTRWKEHLPRIQQMGFNAVYVNPFHYPGFSGSLYSPKDFFKFNPVFIDDSSHQAPVDQLRSFIDHCHQAGILFIMDLVINHTAIDCTLIAEHPAWFKRKPDGEIVHPGAKDGDRWIEWGDLAEVDNDHSPDRGNLWNFWWGMMAHYLDVGVDGFRCDMAYQVPADLWRFLIGRAREKKAGCLFLAESLGCSFQQVEGLAKVGFDYLFNSSKYWDFNQPWGMEQYWKISPVVPTIAFPESHDTTRLLEEKGGDLMTVKRQMTFAATFSKGFMIPIGFEFGFRRKLDVVQTNPSWWEASQIDLTGFIRHLSDLKARYPVLNQEPGLQIVDQGNWANIFCFKRSAPGQKTVLVALNKDSHHHQQLFLPDLESILGPGALRDVSPEFAMPSVPRRFEYGLRPSEVKILTVE